MNSFSLPVGASGPIVSVQVGFSRGRELAIRRSGRAVLSPIDLKALVDTGADVSMIDHGLLTPFVREGMDLNGIVHVNAPGLGGLAFCPEFLASLRVIHPTGTKKLDLLLSAIHVVEQSIGAPEYQVLIGRDILSRCVFHYDGPKGEFGLTY